MKRYVRLESGEVIVSTELQGISVSEPTITAPHTASDNLLDLVRVGDCVEIESSVYLHKVYEQVYKGLDNQVLPYIYMDVHIETQYPLRDVNKKVIQAIWFRSGDTMRRYEVK